MASDEAFGPVNDLTKLVSVKPRWEGRMASTEPDSEPGARQDENGDEVFSDRSTSTAKTIWNIANAIQSVSVLSLPYAVFRGGWVALGALIVVAIMSNITGKLLIDCLYDKPLPSMLSRITQHPVVANVSAMGRINAASISVSESMPLIAVSQPVLVRSTYASIGQACWPFGGQVIVLLVQCVELLGVCSLMLVLMGSAIGMLTSQWVDHSLNVWITVSAGIVLPTVLLPRLSQLGWLSLVGVFTIFGVVSTILANSVSKYKEWHFVNFPTPSWQHFPIALGIVVFGYAAHGQFPSFHIRMEKPLRFGFALNVSFFLVAILDMTSGVLGYLAYGSETKDIINQNMQSPWNHIIDVLLLINLVLSYALPMFPVSAMMDRFLRRYFPLCGKAGNDGGLRLFYFITTRMFLVGITLLVAVSIPNFHLLMSFIGSITCVLLVFVLPCVFHLVLHRSHLTMLGKSVNIILVLISTAAGVSGVYASYTELSSS
ncbi:vesicular inhibitory amino acid transporter-like [Sycon ciliatum]|uniref:vesicular inhibitory amino acid transporter-like n=1 Tax=Sycon ciliatum TaxID=27933 RepID=UPI0020A9E1E7|eukprot:scpid49329/ scgid22155/ Vesicular inhibitory amino acid transporter; GABA and glycine transporter; Solute carrier family 32 member 1; Vesicular GABA transporter